jgi:hypothetical protein
MAKKKTWNQKLNTEDVSAIARKSMGIRKEHIDEINQANDFLGALMGFAAAGIISSIISQPSPRQRAQAQKAKPLAIDDGNTIDAEWEVVDE